MILEHISHEKEGIPIALNAKHEKKLLGSALFAACDTKVYRSLIQSLTPISMLKGQTFSSLSKIPAVVFLLDGNLDVYTSSYVLLSTLKSGDFFEPVSIFSSIKPLLPLHIRARTNCIITMLDKTSMLSLLDNDPVFSRNYMKLSADTLQTMLCRLEYFTAATPSIALSLYLLRNHTHHILRLPDGFAGLARRLNISRATLYRALSELEQQGLVSHHEKTIRILNHQKLLDFACSHAHPSATFPPP